MTATQTAHSGARDAGAAGADIGRQLVAGIGEAPAKVVITDPATAESFGPAVIGCEGDVDAVVAQVINHFVDLGHTRIAMIAGITRDNDRASGRVAGVKAALKNRGLSLPAHYLIEKPYKIAAGREALRSLLSLKSAPTAVFCASDVLAFGVLVECAAQNISVPSELSVVGSEAIRSHVLTVKMHGLYCSAMYSQSVLSTLLIVWVPSKNNNTTSARRMLRCAR